MNILQSQNIGKPNVSGSKKTKAHENGKWWSQLAKVTYV
jgi:hypothetical protein